MCYAGSNFFNISPPNTDGKYAKKAVSMMMHIVFKVAKAMAPSVIFIDEVEKVFLSDKKKLKEFQSIEPYNRVKKDLVKVRRQDVWVGTSCLHAPLNCVDSLPTEIEKAPPVRRLSTHATKPGKET
jgi:ATPase family associated with various cellular activities (AAA)